MNCPKCKENNPSDAYFCHNCGKKLRTKINGWLVCSITLFVATVILGFLAFDYVDGMSYYKTNYDNLFQEKQEILNQLNRKNSEISVLDSRISELNSENSRLRNQIPQTYYTKYANQTIYYWNGHYRETDYIYPDLGTQVCIYKQSDGYGLTVDGWIPMNRLEKQKP